MSVDTFIEELSAEASEAVRALLRRAYDTGFREALASAGQPAVAEPAAPVAPAATTSAAEPAPVLEAAPPSAVNWSGGAGARADDPSDDDDAGEYDDNAEESVTVRPILPHATIGTLRRRIFQTFDLGRFAIDVVICREDDADRRQLQNRARLKLYRREEQ